MLGSITPLGERGRGNRWWLTAAAFAAASAAGGAAMGAALGTAGWALAGAARAAGLGGGGWRAVAVGGIGALALGGLLLDARVGGLGVPTIRRQVDERWLGAYRGWVVGAGFGAQLGVGVVTIVTASTTWVALGAAALSASPAAGLAVGAVFGSVRAVPLLLIARTTTVARVRRLHLWLARAAAPVRSLTMAGQASVGIAALAALATGAL